MPGNFVYILRCADNTFYTGWTTDLERRLNQHLCGKASKYTRSRLPVVCVYTAMFASQQQAMAEEYRIKQLSRSQKDELVAGS